MRLKKNLTLFLSISLLISISCLSQSNEFNHEKATNFEVGVHQHFLMNQGTQAKQYYKYPLIGMDLIYWRDIPIEDKTFEEGYIDKDDLNHKTNKTFGHPTVGVYAHSIFNLDPDLGIPVSLGLTTDITILQTDNAYLSLRPKLGLAYFTNKFDSITNIENTLISSSFNINLQFGIYYSFQKNKKTVKIGSSFIHYSNSAITLPNMGLNFLTLGLAYQFGPSLLPVSKDEKKLYKELFKETKKENSFYLQSGLFAKQIKPNGKRYVGTRTAIGYYRELNLFMNFSSQLAWINNPSISAQLNSPVTLESAPNNNRLSVSSGIRFQFHRFNLTTSVGAYLYKPEKTLDKPWFINYQMDLELTKHIYIFGSLHSHLAVADFADFGIGFTL